MKITYNWLKEFVDFPYTPPQLAERLTMAGLEVESLTQISPHFSGVMVGKILNIQPHPNSQKLLFCEVDTGKQILKIVCGARNISEGDLVPVAAAGAVLADNTQISNRKVMGVESYGMLCSEKELGLSDESHGIFILSPYNIGKTKLTLGSPLKDSVELTDTVFEINVTPNRADALSVIGIARDIAALSAGTKIKLPVLPDLSKKNTASKNPAPQQLVSVTVKSPALCPRYTARVILGIKVSDAPFWIRYRLRNTGSRPVNNIVDITNYTLLETGQPLHAFDLAKLNGREITVRTAKPGEKLETIDGKTRLLDDESLVIADAIGPVALAGIMGGKATEVGPDTTEILLESAFFNPVCVRKTSKRIGLVSESSHRFERGIDPNLPPFAANLATGMIIDTAGGHTAGRFIDIKKNLPKTPLLNLDIRYCRRVVGIDLPKKEVSGYLSGLGCRVSVKNKNVFSVKPPSWRNDLKHPVDLIEEIVRLKGYENIPASPPLAGVRVVQPDGFKQLIQRVYLLLTSMGLSETITYSFINPRDLSVLGMPAGMPAGDLLVLENPVDANMCVMRPSLLPGIINTVAFNTQNENASAHIFEAGKCFYGGNEPLHLALAVIGDLNEMFWRKKEVIPDFFYMKGIIESLFNSLEINAFRLEEIKKPAFHPLKTLAIKYGDTELGFFGEVHPETKTAFGIKDQERRLYLAEINLSSVYEIMCKEQTRNLYRPLPKFPRVRRDISIVLDKHAQSHDIIRVVKDMGAGLLESVDIFDIYEGPPIPETKKSISLALTYRDKEKTLTDEEVDSIHNDVRQRLVQSLPAEIR